MFLITLLLCLCVTSNLVAQECDTALEEALESFSEQNYTQVIALLTACPPERLLEKIKKTMAYELLAMSYFVSNRVDSAKVALQSLLDLQPGYSPQEPQYKKEFIKIVEEVRNERARHAARSLFRNKWFWMSGVAASSVVAFFLFSKEEGPALLPEAPDPPEFP